MPEDFYEFFEFAKGVNGKDPCGKATLYNFCQSLLYFIADGN